MTLGGTGVGSSIVMYPMAMNQLLGTKFNIITGYQLTTDIDLAMQRGEVQSRSGSYTSLKIDHPDWVRDHKIVPLVQIGPKRDAELADVPLITELATSPQDREVMSLISTPIAMGRPLLAPPGVPAERAGADRPGQRAPLPRRSSNAPNSPSATSARNRVPESPPGARRRCRIDDPVAPHLIFQKISRSREDKTCSRSRTSTG